MGGDIPVAPLLAMPLLVLGGFCAPYATGVPGTMFRSQMFVSPSGAAATYFYYVLPAVRIGSALLVAHTCARLKRDCDVAMHKVNVSPAFEPVPAVVDTGPYANCRNPMYVALLGLPGAVGLACDNAWVAIGSSVVLWLYLHLMVVPVEENYLLEQLGEAYAKYCASVKRWGFF